MPDLRDLAEWAMVALLLGLALVSVLGLGAGVVLLVRGAVRLPEQLARRRAEAERRRARDVVYLERRSRRV